MHKNKRAQLVEEIIELAYASLESHMGWTQTKKLPRKETPHFHKKSIQEYAKIIINASKLY